MEILITGSEGLIGRHIVKALQSNACNVVHFDINTENPMVLGDTTNPQTLASKIKNCSGIVHLAAVSRVVWGHQNPGLCKQINVEGTRNVLEAAKNSPNKPWVLFVSSREVYGQQTEFPVKENAMLKPMNVYAQSKVDGEMLTNEYRKMGVRTAIVRLSSVYGCPKDHHDRVIPAFCKGAANGADLRIDGTKHVFDFTHVHDVTRGLVKVVELLSSGKDNIPTIHLASGVETTLLEAAQMAIAEGDPNTTFHESTPRSYDVSKFCGDPELAKKVLGWSTEISIQDGIRDLVKAFSKMEA